MQSPQIPGRFKSAFAAIILAAIARTGLTDQLEKIPDQFVAAFAIADQNRDNKLSPEEFTSKRAAEAAAKRDFHLFDLNQDGFLTLAEFWSVPDAVPGQERGPIPDPLLVLVDESMKALDASLGKWNEHPDTEFMLNQFVQVMQQLFSKKQLQVDTRYLDADKNRKINRDEARRFIEMQLGVRNGAGALLRRTNGQIINYALFLHIDDNHNGTLERQEFKDRSYPPANPDLEFDTANADQDDHLTVEEFAGVRGRCLIDPILEFRRIDANLDAFVSPEELKTGTVDWQQSLVPFIFPGFDVDRNGKLSLQEFRLTPQSNMIIHWAGPFEDTDGNGRLSFAEFQYPVQGYLPFDRTQFPLLRLVCFERLDQNADGELDPGEYFFKRKVPDEFFVMNEDGTGWKSLFRFEGHSACGSVAVSPDGKSISFDSWPGAQQGGSAIYVMNLDDKKPRQLCTGMMPTWSKDGQFLTCSRNENPSGVWILDVDGDKPEYLCPGWGAQWSPDGNRIAHYVDRDLKVFDLVKEELKTVLDNGSNPYQQIYWNMAWSPDSGRICIKGTKSDGTTEVATLNTSEESPVLKIHFSGKVAVNADFAWHPRGDRIVFAMLCAERGFMQLYEFDPNKSDPPRLMKGQPENRNNTDMSWSPDGKLLYVVSGDF